ICIQTPLRIRASGVSLSKDVMTRGEGWFSGHWPSSHSSFRNGFQCVVNTDLLLQNPTNSRPKRCSIYSKISAALIWPGGLGQKLPSASVTKSASASANGLELGCENPASSSLLTITTNSRHFASAAVSWGKPFSLLRVLP